MTEQVRESNDQGSEEMEAFDRIMESLRAPFPKDTINWRVVATTKDKERALVVPYMDARMVMHRLDDVVGPENWNTEGVFGDDGRTMCKLAVRVMNRWVTRTGVSGFLPSELERRRNMGWSDLAKGAWSEAFKIAASSLGIGRYLYDEQQTWVSYDAQRKQITDEALEMLGGGGRYELGDQPDDHPEDRTESSAGQSRGTAARATGSAPASEQTGPGTHRRDGTPRETPARARGGPISDKQRKLLWGMSFGVLCARHGVERADDVPKDERFQVMNEVCDEFGIDRIDELPASQFDKVKIWLDMEKDHAKGKTIDKQQTQAEEPEDYPPVEDYDDLAGSADDVF